MASTVQGPIQIRRRAAGQSAGAPGTLRSGELAINFSDNWMYIGVGDNGSGVATSVVRIAGYQKFVELSGDQTVGGVKTFTLSPKVPTPTVAGDAANKGYVDSALSAVPAGDMTRAVYDTDNDGIVDRAELADAVLWSNVTNKPSEYPPANFDAGKITSGTVDPARLPAAIFAAPVVSGGGIADLTTAQQNNIYGGSQVVTADGRLWTYSGTGSKTAEASYVELADKTPEWSVIANKPTTRAGYGITDAQPLDATLTAVAGLTHAANQLMYFTGVDTVAVASLTAFGRSLIDDADAATARTTLGLGTLAVQNSSAVTVTGGTFTNITIADATWDGGAF